MGYNSIERQLSFCAWQDHVESRDTIACDEEQRISKVKNFTHLAAADFFGSGKFD